LAFVGHDYSSDRAAVIAQVRKVRYNLLYKVWTDKRPYKKYKFM